MASVQYPIKKREMQHRLMDSTVWNGFKIRADDVVIASYPKSGTTWTQQVVAQLVWGAGEHNVADLSPWLERRVPAKAVELERLEAQTHRRVIKTHLPVDALVISPVAKYIARDGRDVCMSWYNHHSQGNDLWYRRLNDTPGFDGPPFPKPAGNAADCFHHWLASDGEPLWPFFQHVKSWWDIRQLPNVLLLHYNQMKEDLHGEITRIARFLRTEVVDIDAIMQRCTFKYMKEHADVVVPVDKAVFAKGATGFINEGTNGRWHDQYSPEDCAMYEKMAMEQLGTECACWLATGKQSQ